MSRSSSTVPTIVAVSPSHVVAAVAVGMGMGNIREHSTPTATGPSIDLVNMSYPVVVRSRHLARSASCGSNRRTGDQSASMNWSQRSPMQSTGPIGPQLCRRRRELIVCRIVHNDLPDWVLGTDL